MTPGSRATRADLVLDRYRQDAIRGEAVAGVAGGLPPTTRRWLRYKSQQNNHLVCRDWDGELEGAEDVLVLKRPGLRHVSADYAGITSITTLAADKIRVTNGTITETVRVTESWQVNEEIEAEYRPMSVGGVDYLWVEVGPRDHAWAVVSA